MAKYKNREVTIVKEIPHAQGDQVVIEHKELSGQLETVPMNQVVLSKDEKKAKDNERAERAKSQEANPNDYRVEGVNDTVGPLLPLASEVAVQRQAERNLERHEEVKKEDEAWAKAHPKAPAHAKQQLDSIKVVPYLDEQKSAKQNEKK